MQIQKYIFVIFCLVVFKNHSQNKKFIFGNNDVPQSLLLNPGEEVSYKKHIGIPFVSGLYFNIGSNNLTVKDIVSDDGVDINDKIRNLIFKLKSTDYITVNEQVDVINIGYKLKNDKDYLNFGFYQEFDFVAYYPKDLAVLFYQGNTDINGNIELNSNTNFNQISFKGQAFGVFHAGISRKINKRLNVGARVKLYSGSFNVQSVNNKGSFSTVLGENNMYQHQLNNVSFLAQSSGILKDDEVSFSAKSLMSNLFVGGNFGLGVDVGFSYRLNERTSLSASALDIGFISYSKDVSSYSIKGNYAFEGIGLLFPEQDQPISYWEDLILDFDEQLVREEKHKTYISFPSAKINAGLLYGFGKQIRMLSNSISCNTNKGFSVSKYQNEIGAQFYSILRPQFPQMAATVFYNRRLGTFLKTKISYTIDNYSFSNVGFGFSTQINKLNFYAAVDNILGYEDLFNSKKTSFSLGANLIFD